jgi:hypothetical protein
MKILIDVDRETWGSQILCHSQGSMSELGCRPSLRSGAERVRNVQTKDEVHFLSRFELSIICKCCRAGAHGRCCSAHNDDGRSRVVIRCTCKKCTKNLTQTKTKTNDMKILDLSLEKRRTLNQVSRRDQSIANIRTTPKEPLLNG